MMNKHPYTGVSGFTADTGHQSGLSSSPRAEAVSLCKPRPQLHAPKLLKRRNEDAMKKAALEVRVALFPRGAALQGLRPPPPAQGKAVRPVFLKLSNRAF